jgi:hypothetical protein
MSKEVEERIAVSKQRGSFFARAIAARNVDFFSHIKFQAHPPGNDVTSGSGFGIFLEVPIDVPSEL